MSTQALSERLDRYRQTLKRLITEGADKRIITSWQARINKMETPVKGEEEDMPRPAAVKDKPTSAKEDAKERVKTKRAARKDQAKGIPGRNHMTYPDLDKTDPTFGGRGTTHCMCGCQVKNKRGGRFQAGHDNRFRQLLGRIGRGEEAGDSIAATTLEDLRANTTLTVGSYTAKDILKLSTRQLRKGRK